MRVEFKTNKIKKICTDANQARKVHGEDMARKIVQRIMQLKAADDVDSLITNGIGRCHKLTGDRDGQYAMDLCHPYRLVFEIIGDTIEIANIIEIVDYH